METADFDRSFVNRVSLGHLALVLVLWLGAVCSRTVSRAVNGFTEDFLFQPSCMIRSLSSRHERSRSLLPFSYSSYNPVTSSREDSWFSSIQSVKVLNNKSTGFTPNLAQASSERGLVRTNLLSSASGEWKLFKSKCRRGELDLICSIITELNLLYVFDRQYSWFTNPSYLVDVIKRELIQFNSDFLYILTFCNTYSRLNLLFKTSSFSGHHSSGATSQEQLPILLSSWKSFAFETAPSSGQEAGFHRDS